MRTIVAALAVAALSACSGGGDDSNTQQSAPAPAEQPPPAPEPTEPATEQGIERTGRVVVSGPEGIRMVSVFTDAGESVPLTGDLLEELTRLSGAVVRVTGTPAQAMGRTGVDVAEYEVVSVDGQTPAVGVLSGGGGAFSLEGDRAVDLVGVPDELASQVGALIWVTGPETADGQRVQSYGVIRPAG